jgi:hypothetical protein
MNYAMSREILMCEDSVERTFQGLRNPVQFPIQPNLVSSFIDRLVRYELYLMLVETARDVLKDLEEALQSKDKKLWASCLCGVLIICLCGELTQLDQNMNNIYEIQKLGEELGTSRHTSIGYCRQVEYHLVGHYVNKFHSCYKSQQKTLNKRNQNGFNPIRDGLSLDNEYGLGQAEVSLANEIRKILRDNSMLLVAFMIGF